MVTEALTVEINEQTYLEIKETYHPEGQHRTNYVDEQQREAHNAQLKLKARTE